MKLYIIGLIVLISPLITFAHNPLSARYHLTGTDAGSALAINLSQDGVNTALLKHYNQDYLNALSEQAFKELVVEYVKGNFHLSIDGKEMILGEGGIKLGAHQTDLKFVLPPIQSKPKKLEVNISAFKENGNHQTIFVYNINGLKGKEILSEHKGFDAKILLNEEARNKNSKINLAFAFLAICIFSIGVIVVKNRMSEKSIAY